MSGTRSSLIGGELGWRPPPDRARPAAIIPLVRRDHTAAVEPDPAVLAEPGGVTIELFARIASAVAARADSGVHGTELARQCGIEAEDWLLASKLWNIWIASYPGVAAHFMALCEAAGSPESLTW
jgi:hypothetical protein